MHNSQQDSDSKIVHTPFYIMKLTIKGTALFRYMYMNMTLHWFLRITNALSAGRILSIPFCVWLDFINIVTFLVSGSSGQLQFMNLFPKKEDVVNTLSPIKTQADIAEFLTAVVVPDKVSLYHNVVV